MKKILFSFIALFLLSLSAFAQETREIREEGKILFKPHAYLLLQGGGAHTLGEAKFDKLLSPAAAFSVGYKMSPVLGLRVGASGWEAKGAAVFTDQVYKFNYLQGNLDLMVDLGSLFGGFNAFRTVNPYIFGGGGFAHGFNNDEAVALKDKNVFDYLWTDTKNFFPVGRFGLGVDLRLSDHVALNVEGNANVLSDHFNSRLGDNVDWQFNALVGLKIKLGKGYTRTEPVYYEPVPVQPASEPAPEPAPVVESPEAAPAVDQLVVKNFPELPVVHFVRGSSKIDTQKHAAELATIVSTLKEFKEDAVEITGYCDHVGSVAVNDRLSLRRAEALKQYLIQQGINGSRISTRGRGKDQNLTGEDAYSVKARRVEVTKN